MSSVNAGDSYSYSYSYEYEDDDGDDSDQTLVAASVSKKSQRGSRNAKSGGSTTAKKVAQKKKAFHDSSSSPIVRNSERPPTTSTRNKKEEAISHLLCRWWFVLPPWPQEDWDYTEELNKNKLNLVPLDEWADAGEFAENGFRNCYALCDMTGFYRLATGDLMDLRPIDGMPSFNGLNQYTYHEICSMVVIALENQIEDMKDNVYRNTDAQYLKDLETKLKRLLEEYKRKI